jgi:hypothetical protein
MRPHVEDSANALKKARDAYSIRRTKEDYNVPSESLQEEIDRLTEAAEGNSAKAMVDAVRGVPSKLRDTSASYPGLNRASWF